MLTGIITLALVTQTPQPNPTPAPRAQIQRQTPRAGIDYSDVLARNRARRSAKVSTAMARERAEAEAAYAAQVKAEAEYKAALPFLLESQRQQLERLSALERNAALHRMAAANEQIARAIAMDVVARQNARLGYPTPALNTFGPGVSDYGPYGGVIIQPQYGQPLQGQMAAPYSSMGFPG